MTPLREQRLAPARVRAAAWPMRAARSLAIAVALVAPLVFAGPAAASLASDTERAVSGSMSEAEEQALFGQLANVSVQALLAVNDGSPIGSIRVGCSALTAITLSVNSSELSNATQACPSPLPNVTDLLKSLLISSFGSIIEQGVKQAINDQVCASP